jgi:hypothetical protein
MEWIKTDRGMVRVIGKECAKRPCLHVHWSRHSTAVDVPERGPKKGWEVKTFPLVCVRNEEYGCPHPLPDPEEVTTR